MNVRKYLLILYSYHHKNTEKVANVFSKVLDAEIRNPQQISPKELTRFDLIGFGSGIYSAKHHKFLLDLANSLLIVQYKNAFIFSTAAMTSEKKKIKDHSELRKKLESKGYVIIDEFQCKGYNTNSFMKYFGGMNKGRPNTEDLKCAEEFAQNLKQHIK